MTEAEWLVCENPAKMITQITNCHGTGTIPTAELDRDRLLILADALEEAGCPIEQECSFCRGGLGFIYCTFCKGTNREPTPVLAHLRGPGPHWRGCHVLQTILTDHQD